MTMPVNALSSALQQMQAMAAEAGAGRVGFRICPGNPFNDLHDDNPGETFAALLQAATPLNLAYLHLIYVPALPVDGLQLAQQNYRGAMIINESLTLESAQRYIENGIAAAASIGLIYLSNPEQVERFRRGAELAQPDRNTMYTPGPKGYTDYPFLP